MAQPFTREDQVEIPMLNQSWLNTYITIIKKTIQFHKILNFQLGISLLTYEQLQTEEMQEKIMTKVSQIENWAVLLYD